MTATAVRSMPIFRQVELTGSVTSQRNARLSAAISGLVLKLHVDIGSRVERGELLLELDAELTQLQLQRAQARVLQASKALADAKRRLTEARELVPQRSIAESAVRDLESEVAEDDAVLQQAQAEARYQSALLQRHQLTAPFDGVVSARLTELGEWVTPGQGVLELVATGDLRLDFPVSEEYLGVIDADSLVTYHIGAESSRSLPGRVETVVPVADPGARTFLLRVLPQQKDPSLIAGMSVRATVKLPGGRDGLVVPRDAILRYPDGRSIVWSLKREGTDTVVVENRVQTGMAFDGLVEIRHGLRPDARVVVQGNEALSVGQRVQVKAEPETAAR